MSAAAPFQIQWTRVYGSLGAVVVVVAAAAVPVAVVLLQWFQQP